MCRLAFHQIREGPEPQRTVVERDRDDFYNTNLNRLEEIIVNIQNASHDLMEIRQNGAPQARIDAQANWVDALLAEKRAKIAAINAYCDLHGYPRPEIELN